MTKMTDDEASLLTGLRRALHREPELAFEEERTADTVCRVLDEAGIAYEYALDYLLATNRKVARRLQLAEPVRRFDPARVADLDLPDGLQGHRVDRDDRVLRARLDRGLGRRAHTRGQAPAGSPTSSATSRRSTVCRIPPLR